MRRPTDSLRQRTPAAVHASQTGGPSFVRAALLAAAAVLFLSLAGAFGTGEAPVGVRLGYWALTIGLGASAGMAGSTLFARRGWLEGPPAQTIALLTLAIALPLTVVVWALTGWIFGGRLVLARLPDFALPVLAITGVLTTLNVLLGGSPVVTHAAPSPPEASAGETPAPRVRFLDRLPPKLKGADLFAVEAEDHYLRLHTSRGSDLILFRLADAMAELEGIEGAQTHRSWWVARQAVQGATRSDGRATLSLPGDVEAPVSRTYARALKEAGWF